MINSDSEQENVYILTSKLNFEYTVIKTTFRGIYIDCTGANICFPIRMKTVIFAFNNYNKKNQ